MLDPGFDRRFPGVVIGTDEAGRGPRAGPVVAGACILPEGYIPEVREVLTEAEIESLPVGAAVITLELASRFLGDYLIGDRYFHIDAPDQNLRRAQAQLVLFRDMMAHMDEMKRIIREVRERPSHPEMEGPSDVFVCAGGSKRRQFLDFISSVESSNLLPRKMDSVYSKIQ